MLRTIKFLNYLLDFEFATAASIRIDQTDPNPESLHSILEDPAYSNSDCVNLQDLLSLLLIKSILGFEVSVITHQDC